MTTENGVEGSGATPRAHARRRRSALVTVAALVAMMGVAACDDTDEPIPPVQRGGEVPASGDVPTTPGRIAD